MGHDVAIWNIDYIPQDFYTIYICIKEGSVTRLIVWLRSKNHILFYSWD